MDYEFPSDLQEMRAALRKRVATAFPDGFPTIFNHEPEPLEASIEFCRAFGADGLMTMAWPKEYGGRDAPLWAQIVVAEELWAHNEPRGGQYYGPNWVGPTIMNFGTEAQKDEHLSRISSGRALWAQGYSEPEAGSDLASLRLKAERVEGGWELTGQKIWTSFADYAEWIIVLTRTNPGAKKQEGITVFLLPMDRQGIEVRPIREMTGHHDFNEVFFDRVYASDDEVLGEVDDGWTVATASLGFERVGNPRWARVERLLAEARQVMVQSEEMPGSETVAQWVHAALNCRISRLLHYRAVAEREKLHGKSVPPLRASVFRAFSTLNDQFVSNTALDCVGAVGLLGHGEDGVPAGGEIQHEWRLALTATVAAGTYEVLQMVIARETLGKTKSAS